MKGENIHVKLGRKEILHGVDFDAEPGKVTAIIGPNGSGKSTLLKALSGELESSGEISLNGHSISELKPWQLAAMRGVLPQSSTVAFPFTVLEIVRLGLANGLAAADDSLPSRALAHVDLAGFEHRSYQNLSGGEQQRVQLARVLQLVELGLDVDALLFELIGERLSGTLNTICVAFEKSLASQADFLRSIGQEVVALPVESSSHHAPRIEGEGGIGKLLVQALP